VNNSLGKCGFYLRDICPKDKDMIRKWRNSLDVSRYMYTDHQITEEEHDRWFKSVLKDIRRKYWIIMDNREAIGLVNLYDIDEKNKRCFWAFYTSGKNTRGKGVGSIVEYYVMKYVFEGLEYNKLCCEILSINQSVTNMHKSFGFREEGVFRQHTIKNGEYVDVIALAMLKSEWDEMKPHIEARLINKGLI
jgi:UDP-4-amino-4,6-dideoxy-N-acetyl-beta-L-altrosamine N-acetyltransferase